MRAKPIRSPARIRGAALGEPLQRLDRGQDLHHLDLGARAALLAGDQLDQLVELVDHRLRRARHVARAVLDAQDRPQALDLRRAVDGGGDVARRRRGTEPSSFPPAGLRDSIRVAVVSDIARRC